MEPIAHLEWTLGIGLISFSLWNVEITGLAFLLLGVGSVFPDIFDAVIFRGKKFSKGHREFSHTIFFLILLVAIGQIIPIIQYLAFGIFLHLIEDILAGREYVYLLSPITHMGGLMLVSKDRSIKIGGIIRNTIKGSFLGSENIGDELSWFWFLTIIGSWIFIIGLFLYFS